MQTLQATAYIMAWNLTDVHYMLAVPTTAIVTCVPARRHNRNRRDGAVLEVNDI